MAETDAFGNDTPSAARNAGGLLALRIAIIAIALGTFAYIAHDVVAGPALDCLRRGISTSAAREGSCTAIPTNGGPRAEFRVVDLPHVLQMPGYAVRIARTRIEPTRVPEPRDEDIYPDGHGLLVSIELVLTNTGDSPLALLGGPRKANNPRYLADKVIQLITPDGFGGLESGYPAMAELRTGPSPYGFGSIRPGATASGWVSFVCSLKTEHTLRMRSSELLFYEAGGARKVIGQIRLWK